jgi:hypothetical protein
VVFSICGFSIVFILGFLIVATIGDVRRQNAKRL